jgi:hypothetical protein
VEISEKIKAAVGITEPDPSEIDLVDDEAEEDVDA